MRLVLVAVLTLISAPAAARQAAPADAAGLRAEGDALLAAAGAQEIFLNETGEASGPILLRHRPSGYRCVFTPRRPENGVLVFPHAHPGHNVGCRTATAGGTQTLYFTHEPAADITEQLALETAVVSIRQRFPAAQPAPAAARPGQATGGAPRAQVAVLTHPGGDERVDVGKRGDWLVKYRFSAPAGAGRQGGPLDALWTATVAEGERWRAQAGAAAGAAPAPAPALRPAAPRSIEQQRADARNIIEASGAAGVFDIVEEGELVMYRHRPSGMTCSFPPGSGRLALGAQGGRAYAACITLDPTGRHPTTLGVQPNPRRLDAGRALQSLVQGLTRDGRLRPATGPGVSASVGPGRDGKAPPPHRSVGLEGSVDGQPTYVRASAAAVGDWILTEVSHQPAGDRMQADLLGELVFVAMVQRMADAQAAARR